MKMNTTLSIQPYKCVLRRDGRLLRVAEETASSAAQAAAIAHAYLAQFPHEEVIAILLDGRNAVIGIVKIAQGGLHGCALTPPDVLRPVLASGASAYILAHNHPSGDPTPSLDDLTMTRAVAAASDVIGIRLLDHIVVTRDPSRWSSIC